nr:unnamed protein product [Digitaria exilis]
MLMRCDVCGVEPAAVLCCADEAALCSACDRRVHRANKLADKHRRVPLAHPAAGDDAPLCDVCKERRGLVFCVEDRAILCADCDEPIHSANDLTAKHSRFLLVGAKLSSATAPIDNDDHAPPSPTNARRTPSDEPHHGVAAAAAAVCAPQAQDSSAAKVSALTYGGGGKGSSISEYLTNICPGFRVDDLLFDDAAFSAATEADEYEQVPSLDADLFDVVAGRPAKGGGGAWYGGGGVLGMDKQAAPVAASIIAVPTAKQQQHQAGRVRERQWDCDSDSDLFAVPEFSPPAAKKARPTVAPSSFWCF